MPAPADQRVGRVARLSGPSTVRVAHVEVTPPAAGEVLIAIRYCGICGTDVHGFADPDTLPPSVFGHEWTGTVVAVGADVRTVAAGDRVVVGVGPPCETCRMCRAGHADHCQTVFAEANGVSPGAPAHGGFATYVTVAERRAVIVADELTDEQAALIEPAAVTFHALRRTGVPRGAAVVVQGAGPIGLLVAQQARHAGAGPLLLVEPNEARRDAARRLGFADVVTPGDDVRAWLRATTAGLGADVMFECTGSAALLQSAAELVRRGGTLSLLGYPSEPSTVSYADWQRRELRVVASVAFSRADFAGAMASLASGAVDVTPLITRVVGLDELAPVLTALAAGASRDAKVLVDPNLPGSPTAR